MILTGPSTERIFIQLLAGNPCTNEPGARCPTWQAKAANFIGLQSIPVVFRIQAQPSIFCSSLLLLSSDHILFIFPGAPQAIQKGCKRSWRHSLCICSGHFLDGDLHSNAEHQRLAENRPFQECQRGVTAATQGHRKAK